MEQVIRIYGRFVLEVVVFALLIGLLMIGMVDGQGNQGIFRMLGAHIEEETVVPRVDIEQYQRDGEVPAPTIFCANPQALQLGTYEVEAIVNATNSQGEQIPVTVESLRDPYGMVQIDGNMPEVSQVSFMMPGIYTLRVSARDERNRVSICEFRVPINDLGVMY